MIDNNSNKNSDNNNNDLREVGLPSRTILHGKGVGSKSRNRVRTRVGCFFGEKTQKMKETRLPRGFGLLRDPVFLAPRMRDIYTNFKNHTFFEKNVFCRKKTKKRLPRGRRPLRDPLLLAPIMRDTIRNFIFCKSHTIEVYKNKICKIAQEGPPNEFFCTFF